MTTATVWLETRHAAGFELCATDRSRPLPRECAEIVIADLTLGLPGLAIEAYFRRWPDSLQELDHLAAARDRQTGRYIAVSGLQWLHVAGEEVLYIRIGFTARAFQGTHATALAHLCAITRALAARDGRWIAAKSNNPSVHRIFLALEPRVPGLRAYPDIGASVQPAAAAELARALARSLCPGDTFAAERGVIVGGQASTCPDLFPEPQRSRDEALNRYFDTHVGAADQLLSLMHVPATSLPGALAFARGILESGR